MHQDHTQERTFVGVEPSSKINSSVPREKLATTFIVEFCHVTKIMILNTEVATANSVRV
jgi:hypothetical protein